MSLDRWRCVCRWEGAGSALTVQPDQDGKPRVLCPSSGHSALRIAKPAFALVASTDRKAASVSWRKAEHRGARCLTTTDPYTVAAFTDGSSSGSFAAVVLDVESGLVEEHVRHPEPCPTRNVAAEILGVALALKHSPEGARVLVVSDYFGTGLFLNGAFALRCARTALHLRAVLAMIDRRRLSVDFVHHRGHQTDVSEFTAYNSRADELAGAWARRAFLDSKGCSDREAVYGK